MKTAIIYHDADFDGLLSKEVCQYQLGRADPDNQLLCVGWDYGRPLPDLDWVMFDYIFVVDLSVDALMERPELHEKIVWIDHHASAIARWDSDPPHRLAGLRIDGVAACRLCWQWFTADKAVGLAAGDFKSRNVKEPLLLTLAGEYDVWDRHDNRADPLQYGLRAQTDRQLELLVHREFEGHTPEHLDKVIQEGRSITGYVTTANREYAVKYAHTLHWEGLLWCALNIAQRGNSTLFDGALTPGHSACFAWRFDGSTGNCLVSLYHAPGHEHHDLSKIALRYGGGGHKGACGFRVSLEQMSDILCPKQVLPRECA